MKKSKNSYFTRVILAVGLVLGLGFASCSGILGVKTTPETATLGVEILGVSEAAGSRALVDDLLVSSVIVKVYDSTTHAYLGTTGPMVKGATSYTGTIAPSAYGTLRFRAFVKGSTGNFLYYGEATQAVTDLTTSLTAPITVTAMVAQLPVNLDSDQSLGANIGSAGKYVILAKAAISTVPTSAITGDVAVSPAALSLITGFSLVADASNVFCTSTQVTGSVYGANSAVPTPTNLTKAVENMMTAYTDAAGRPTPNYTDLGSGEIGGMTLIPGLYKWTTGISANTNVTLDGGPDDVWIFQISMDTLVANGISISLTGGALPSNIFWQNSGAVSLGATAHMEGIILSQTSITLGTGASFNGRLFAQTSVGLNSNTIVAP